MIEGGMSSRSSSVKSRGNVRKQSKTRTGSAMRTSEALAKPLDRPHTGNTRTEQRQGAQSSTRPKSHVYQQAVYVAPSANPEVVRQAAVEVMQARAQADLIAQHAVEAVVQRDAANAQLRSEATIMISETEKQAMKTIMDERSQAQKRETNLLGEIGRLKNALAHSEVARTQVEANSLKLERATHGTELQSQISDLQTQMSFVVDRLNQIQGSGEELSRKSKDLEDRMVALGNWEVPTIPTYEDALEEFDDDEELVPGDYMPPMPSPVYTQLVSPHASPKRKGATSPKCDDQGDSDDDVKSPEDYLRWKDVSAIRMPALPDSAGSFRAWRNAFLPMLLALDEVPLPDVDSKLHLAIGYQPEPRLLPYGPGCFVWYLGKIKDPMAPKSFSPNGKAAMYT